MPDTTQKPLLLEWGDDKIQVCVPYDWTEEQMIRFAKGMYPTAHENGWKVDRSNERVPCAHRPEFVHVLLGH